MKLERSIEVNGRRYHLKFSSTDIATHAHMTEYRDVAAHAFGIVADELRNRLAVDPDYARDRLPREGDYRDAR